MTGISTVAASIKADIDSAHDWASLEFVRVAAFFKPIIDDIIAAGKTDFLKDIAADAPLVASAFVTGGSSAALASGISAIIAQLEAQGSALADQTITAVGAALAARASVSTSSESTDVKMASNNASAQAVDAAETANGGVVSIPGEPELTDVQIQAMNAASHAAVAASNS